MMTKQLILCRNILTVVLLGLFVKDIKGADPVFNTALPSTYSTVDSTGTGVSVATVRFTDADGDALTLTMVVNDYFQFVDNGDRSGTVNTHATTAVLGASGTTMTLTFIALDPSHSAASGSYNITVANVAPTLSGLPTTTTLSEGTTLETIVYNITCTDPSDTVSSSLVSVSPSSSPNQELFFVQKIPTTTVYAVYNRDTSDSSAGQLSYNTQRDHVLTIECTDQKNAVRANLTVNLQQNQAPVITTPSGSATQSVASTVTAGTVVYTLTATDAESDTFSYNYTSSPTGGPVHVLASGAVQATVDMSTVTASSTYTYTIYPVAEKNVGTSVTLILLITGANAAPTFGNLNNSMIVNENTAAATSIFQVTATDANGDTLTLLMTSDPPYGTALFELDASKNINTKTALNYETITDKVYALIVSVSDTKVTVTGTLTVTIANVNEQLAWTASTYRADIAEGSAVGTVVTPNGLNTTDPDAGDNTTCTMSCVLPGYFSISTGCVVAVSSVYSLDVNPSLPTNVTCAVTGTDSGGNTAATTLIIDIVVTNNYAPTFAASSYYYTISGYEAINTTLGQVNATDGDRGTYGDFSYSLNQTQLTSTIFNINSTSGVITTAISIENCNCTGIIWRLPVYGTDQGGRVGTATAVISVGATTTVPTTTTTDRARTFIEDPKNAAWFSIFLIALAIVVIVMFVVLIKHVFQSTRFVCRERRRPSHRLADRNRYDDRHHYGDDYISARNYPEPAHHQSWRNEPRFW